MNDNRPNITQAHIAHAMVAAIEEFDGNGAAALASVANRYPNVSQALFDAARREAIALLREQAAAAKTEAAMLEREANR